MTAQDQLGGAGPGTPAAYVNRDVVAATTDALQLLLHEVSRERLLTAKEEVALAQRIERGDRAARDAMIRRNLALVVSVARRYGSSELTLLDLIQEGVIGLMQAVDRFDWRRGYRFSTYATWWIRFTVRRAVADKGRTIRIPVAVAERARKIAAAERRLEAQLGRFPLEREVAQAAGLSLQQLRGAREAPRTVASLDQPVSSEDETPLGELIADERPEPAEVVIISLHERELQEALRRAVSELSPRERRIVELRYGIGDGGPLTLARIGEQLGITRERVRQIEKAALERLAHERELQALHAA